MDKAARTIEVGRLVVDKQATSTVTKFVSKVVATVSCFQIMTVVAVSNLYLEAFNYGSDPHHSFRV